MLHLLALKRDAKRCAMHRAMHYDIVECDICNTHAMRWMVMVVSGCDSSLRS